MTNNNENEVIHGDDDDVISTGVASLLRGPIMAANSTISSGGRGGKSCGDDAAVAVAASALGTWQDVGGGERNIAIHTNHHQDVIGATNLTPSMFRKHFFPEETPTPSQVRNGFMDEAIMVAGSANTKKTPGSGTSTRSGSISNELGSISNGGGFRRQHTLRRQKQHQQQQSNTPSMERSHFLPSPQDSVSTMGQLSPSEEYNVVVAVRPPTTTTTGAGDTLMQQHPWQYSTAAGGNSNTNNITNFHPSVDGMIALGEEQMRQNTPANTNNVDNNSKKLQVAVTKKPFLRKGTRREPSALHTRINKSNNNSGDVGLTPSTARLQQQRISPHSSAVLSRKPMANDYHAVLSDTTIESQSARKERLARLEKMQEDLIHDLERRLARKEEAREDRRQLRMMTRKKVTSTPATSAAAKASVTPSQMRTPAAATMGIPSQSTSRRGSATMRNEQMMIENNSRADSSKNSTKETGVNLSVAINATAEHQHEDIITPSQARRASSPTAESIVEKYEAKRNAERAVEDNNVEHPRSRSNDKVGPKVDNADKKSTKSNQPAVRSKSMPRPRSTIRSGNLSREAASFDVDEKKAFEEWKKKEAEQWALIKNMRKRQETALREAEGERERVSCRIGCYCGALSFSTHTTSDLIYHAC